MSDPAPASDTKAVADESKLLEHRDKLLSRQAADRPRQGLALSGGGIRSATFSLGALQAIAEVPVDGAAAPSGTKDDRFLHSLLLRFDYLSTVSGGGYIGAFLVSLFQPGRLRSTSASELEAADDAVRILSAGPPGRIRAADDYAGEKRLRAPLAWLRENGRYMIPTGVGDAVYAAALGLRGWIALHFVIGTLILALLTLLALGHQALHLPLLADWEAQALRWALGQEGLEAIWWSPLFPLALLPALLWGLPLGVAFWLSAGDHDGKSAALNLPVLGMLVAAIVLAGLTWLDPDSRFGPLDLDQALLPLQQWTVRQQVSGGLAVACVLGMLMYIDVARRFTLAGQQRVVLTRQLSLALTAVAAIVVLATIETLGRSLYLQSVQQGTRSAAPVLTPAALVAALVWIGKKGAAMLSKGKKGGWLEKMPLTTLGGLIGFAIFILIASLWGMALNALIWLGQPPSVAGLSDPHKQDFLLILAAATLLLAFVTGQFPGFINSSSLQHFYAARLTRAYLGASNGKRFEPGPSRAGLTVAEPLPDDPLTLDKFVDLSNLSAPKVRTVAPLHIINVTLNKTVDPAEQLVQRDRKGQPMAVMPHGFSVDGHMAPFRTSNWWSEIQAPLDLGQWVGTSGAAFSTGIGRETSLGMSLLMGAANVRLGTWWESGQGSRTRPRQLSWIPAMLGAVFRTQTYLSYELRARFFGLHRTWQYLSDGGHFENTGIYELLREQRKIGLIIACDNGADPDYRFDDLANLMRLARIDLGVEIEVVSDFDSVSELDRLFGTPAAFTEKTKPFGLLLKARHTTAEVPPTWIILIKPALHADAPADVLQYALEHPAFPQEPTTDQFFDEAQWESYRSLGHFIAKKVLTPKTLKAIEELRSVS